MKKIKFDSKIVSKLVYLVLPIIILSTIGYFLYTYSVDIKQNCDSYLTKFESNTACFLTTEGYIIIKIVPEAAPNGTKRFIELVNMGFYNNLNFYRVVDDFVIQGGIQDIAGQLGTHDVIDRRNTSEKIKMYNNKFSVETNFDFYGLDEETKKSLSEQGYQSSSEIKPLEFKYGTVAFANAGPDSNSTEIFIVVSKDSNSESIKSLRGKYTTIGYVLEGSDTIDKILSVKRVLGSDNAISAPTKNIRIIDSAYKS
ncbi:MAG: peptidylprolyl isomerase [Candidatus Dojkabacteria bacterium]|nr:peptidylprolyl isomerase [Candidatus Dojkabacteria bacterium]